MNHKLTLGSLFDGSGGFPLGGLMSGITPLWASEIEPFPVRVTTKRMPEMKHYGDISQLDGGKLEPVDIITFGSPCQDMSVAGKRSGLHGSRSGLFYQAVRIIEEMRRKTDGRYPGFVVWENVQGAFSSGRGEDFRCVLEALCRIKDAAAYVPQPPKGKWNGAGEIVGDGYSVAWRTLDAQYWGVPQRRKRIYLVADLAGERAGKILFESEGVSGYSAEGFRAWQKAAGAAEKCPDAAGIGDAIAVENYGIDGRVRIQENGVVQTLTTHMGTGGNNVPLVAEPVRKVYGICSKGSNSMKSPNPASGFYEAAASRCLDANGGNPTCAQGGMAVVALQGSMIGRKGKNGPQGSGAGEDISFTLNTADRHAVAYSTSKNSHHTEALKNVAGTLVATDYKDPPTVNDRVSETRYIVRRLTPIECARLQGFPDWWCSGLGEENPPEAEIRFWENVFETHRRAAGTASKPKSRKQILKWLADPYSDSAAYKMWGNGVALPNVCFVLAGIACFAENKSTK